MKILIKLLPLLILYIFLVLVNQSADFYSKYGDEERYIKYADNLVNGFYTDKEFVDLTNGPGYPLLLFPFRFFQIPLIYAKVLNAFLYFFLLIYFYKILRHYLEEKKSIFYTYLLGIYPPLLILIPLIYTEIFSAFLVTAFSYHLISFIKNKTKYHLLTASVFLAFLALTRTIFGYVILFSLIIFSVIYFVKKQPQFRKTVLVFIISLLFCLPYLTYTYSLTGKIYYWATNGGEVLYWMSTPFEEEYGDWFSEYSVRNKEGLRRNHQDLFTKIDNLSPLEKDSVFRAEAIKNIKNNPVKYFKNWLANIGRLLFNFPISYSTNKLTTYFYILPNLILLSFVILCTIPVVKYFKSLFPEFKVFLLFIVLYLGGSSIVSANPRYFSIIVPVLIMSIAIIFSHFVKIEFLKPAEIKQ